MNKIIINTAADAVISFIHDMGIKVFHNYPGGTIAPLLDSCIRFNMRIVTSRHEQGAGYAALAQAKITGLPGIVAVTSGPGVTNVLTPVADAYYDSVPMIVFTGQVSTGDLDEKKVIRQSGFQEVKTPELMSTITKGQFQPKTVIELNEILPVAWNLALSGRKGPVSIDLPMDVQRSEYTMKIKPLKKSEPSYSSKNVVVFIDKFIKCVMRSKQPLIISGNGMIDLELTAQLRKIQEIWEVPVSQSLLGVGSVKSNSKLCLGFHGHTGSQFSGIAIAECDLLLVLGSRLDVRQTGSLPLEFASNAKKFRVDFDESEVNNTRVVSDHTLIAPLIQFLPLLLERLPSIQKDLPILSKWHKKIQQYKTEFDWDYPTYTGLSPQMIIERISKEVSSPSICVTGVGSHQHWVARHFDFDYPTRRLLTSCGHGAMGYDLPTSIGAAIHSPDSEILCIVGDGSFQMNIQELGMISEYNLNIKIIILDNERLGLVSQFQLMNWEKDTGCGFKKSPDFATISKGYGIPAMVIETESELEKGLTMFSESLGAFLLHIKIDSRHDVLPMLLGGQKTNQMWPYFDTDGVKRN